MTDLSKVWDEFAVLSSLGENEKEQYESLLYMSSEYVDSLLKNEEDENNSRIVFLCAAKAFYQYALSNQFDGITSFKAGDVSYSLDASSCVENARAIYDFALEQCSALINDNNFAFKAV